ncbi:MAG: hypothetical protein ACI4IQ_07475 [Eubacterium sp.]
MRKAVLKIKRIIKIKKAVKREIHKLTYCLPCVNISVRPKLFYGYAFYNNCDLIAVMKFREIEELLEYGNKFFDIILYCLCIKYSIDNY